MSIRTKPPHNTRQAKSPAERLRLPSHSTTDVAQRVVVSIGVNQGPDGGLRATAQALPWLLPRPFSTSPCVRTWRWSLLGGQSTLAILAYHNPAWAAGRSGAVRTPETHRGESGTGSLSQRLPYAHLSVCSAKLAPFGVTSASIVSILDESVLRAVASLHSRAGAGRIGR